MRSVPFLVLLVLAGCMYEGGYYTTTEQAVPSRQAVTLEDLRALSKAGVSDDVIVARLEAEGAATRPTSEEIAQLKKEGVSDRVLQAWVSAKATPPTTQRKVVYRSPYYAGVYPYYGYPYYGYGGWYGYGWGWGYPYYRGHYRYCY